MIEIARIFTFGTTCRRDIVRRLYAEKNGLVYHGDGYLVVYHDCD